VYKVHSHATEIRVVYESNIM